MLPAIKTVDVESDGAYTFSDVKSLGVQMNADGIISGAYLVEVTACADIYSRPVTGALQQNLSVGSTLVAFVQSSSEASKLATADHGKLQNLISNLETFGTYALAYNHLTTNASTQQIFQDIFVSAPTILQESAPQTAVITVPATAHENEGVPLSMDVSHWKSDYSFAYQWEVDGVTLATTRTATYTTHANSQGQHVIKASYGSDGGGGVLDQTKPYQSQTFTINVSNDVLPQPPVLSVVGSNVLTTNAVTLQIATGAGQTNCQSFSALALTEEDTAPPTSPSAYTVNCTQSPTQNFTHTLTTNGTGTKTLRLWAMDANGNISASPQSASVQYDGPALSFTSTAVQNQLTNTNTVTFSGSCEAGLTLTIAGGTDSSTTTCSAGSWSYTSNSRTTDSTRTYSFIQTDLLGSSSMITGTWQRDTAPPALALASPAASSSAQTGVTLTGSCEAGQNVTFSGTGILSSVSTPCSADSYSQFLYFSSGDGSKSVTVAQTDIAGNTATLTRSFVRDTTAPSITQTVSSPVYTKVNTTTFSGVCEAGLTVTVSGADTATTTCTAGSWSYTTAAQTTDASRTFSFSQTDASGNANSVSATWIRKNTPPVLTFTSSSSFLTSGNSVTFQGTCTTGLSIAVTGSATTSASCSGGLWSYAPTSGSDGTYTYNIRQTDQAGNITTLTGTWQRSTTGPTIVINESTPQLTNGSTLTITGTCSGGTSGIQSFAVTGAVSSTPVTCSGGTFSYTASKSADASYTYDFTITDALSRTSTASLTWIRDITPPTVSALTINNGQANTYVSYNPVSFSAADNLSNVTQFCLKTTSTLPASTDSCWYPVNGAQTNVTPANNITISNYSFNIGIIPQAYSVYLWAMDGARNISSLTNSGVGTSGSDLATVTLAQVAPPTVTTVLASNSDTMNGVPAERTIPAGSTTYVRWTASGSNLSATPIELFFTSDDVTWTRFATNLANGQNNCASVTGSGSASTNATGCYQWTSGSPSSNYYRVRVAVTNSLGTSTFASSLPINVQQIRLLAGNTENGINMSASSSTYVNRATALSTSVDNSSFVVTRNGTIFLRDQNLGLITINPADGIKKVYLRQTGVKSGDGGPVSAATAVYIGRIALDYNQPNQRLWIYDSVNIRRIDLSTNTIETVIGGGSDLGDTVANPRNVNASYTSSSLGHSTLSGFFASPNGDFYFQTYNDINDGVNLNTMRLRYLEASSGNVKSYRISSASTVGSLTSANYLPCRARGAGLIFDSNGQILERLVAVNVSSSFPSCPGSSSAHYFARLTSSWASESSHPPQISSGNNAGAGRFVHGMDRNLYWMSKSNGANGVWKYNSSPANTWTKIFGSSQNGYCVDGTSATSCPNMIDDLFVTEGGVYYILENGMIRTFTPSGTVVTVLGQKLNSVSGTDVFSSRLGVDIRSFQQRDDGGIVFSSAIDNSFYEFQRNGSLFKIAGNGNYGAQTTGVDALTTPTAIANDTLAGSNFGLDPSTGEIYSSAGANTVFKLQRSSSAIGASGQWVTWNGTGSLPPGHPSADGSSNIGYNADCTLNHDPVNFFNPTCNWYPATLGFLNSRILVIMSNISRQNSDSAIWIRNNGIKMYRISDKVQENLVFHTPLVPSDQPPCADGTPLSNCYIHSVWSWTSIRPDYDPGTNTYFVTKVDANRISLLTPGGNMASVSTTHPVRAFAFRADGPNRYIYYCSKTSGQIRKLNLGNNSDTALDWPIPSMVCTHGAMKWDAANNSVIFLYTQNGLMGFAEYLNP